MQKSEEVVARARAEASNRASQFVVVLTENAGLKAAIGLLHEPLATPENTAEIRRTIEAQLREIHAWVGYDLLAITDWMGRPVAAVEFENDDTRGFNSIPDIPQQSSLAIIGGALYEMTQIPISLGGEQFATLTLGARFDLNHYRIAGDMALLHQGHVLSATLPSKGWSSLEKTLEACAT